MKRNVSSSIFSAVPRELHPRAAETMAHQMAFDIAAGPQQDLHTIPFYPNSEIRRHEMMQDFERKSFEEERGISEADTSSFDEMLCCQKIAPDHASQFR